MKYAFLVLIVVTISSTLFAQNNLQFSPEKPLPGNVIKFTYTPPASVFEASDVIECVAYRWGNYDDDFAIATAKQIKPLDIVLKKSGEAYIGEVPTDEDTRLLSFVFSSGELKWKRVERNTILADGKIDNNDSTGYAILFYNQEKKIAQYSNYFMGKYLLMANINKSGFSNPELSTECFLNELENWPDSKYYVYDLLNNVIEKDEGVKSLFLKEMEKLFAAGLETEEDMYLLVILSSSLKLKAQARYFYNQWGEKFRDNNGHAYIYSLYEEFQNEMDLAKKEEIMNKSNRFFAELSYNDKMKLAFSTSVPIYFKFSYLQELANNGQVDDFIAAMQKFNFSIEINPYNSYGYRRALDTLLIKNSDCKAYAEKMAQSYAAFYADRVSKMEAGVQIPAIPYDEYFSKADRKEVMIDGAARFADMYGRILYDAGEYKKGFQYAKEAQEYLQMLIQPPYDDLSDYNNRYSLLAEKVLPAKKCKAEIERMVATGKWKSDMIDILNRIYVKENKTEDGFEAYISGLKQSQNELFKETLKDQMLNEAAPDFSLTDISGKTVNLSDFKGKTVILDFWATWCGPCIASFPAMTKLMEANKNNPGLKFLFVDTFERFKDEKENKDKVVEFMTTKNYPFQVIYDFKSKVSESYKVTGIPTKCIIDKNGNLRYRIVGAELNEAKLIDEINAMIETIK